MPGQQEPLAALGLLGRRVGRVVLLVGPDEDPRTAAAQGAGGDARPLEGLPRCLQQQSLMRVHRECLAGRDTEQRGVETGHVVQEPATAHVGGAGVRRIGVVQLVDVPAAVVGEVRDGVPLLDQQTPQVVRRPDTAGEAARHADDHDRIVLLTLSHAGDRGCLLRDSGQLVPQEGGQLGRTRVVVGRVDRHPVAEQRRESLAQLDAGERVEAEFLEGQVLRDIGGGGVAQDSGAFVQYDVQERRQVRGRGSRRVVAVLGLGDGGCGACLRGQLRPVALALEGVGGEGDRVAGGRPGGGGPCGVRVGQDRGEVCGCVAAKRVQGVDGCA